MNQSLRYRAYGLWFRSDIELPEMVEASAAGPSHVQIRLGTVPETMENAASSGVLYQAGEQRFLLRMDRVARYLVEDGTAITVEPDAGSLASDVRVFLLGSCLGALLHQRGVLALHASAIQTDAGAVLFAGPSGIGKSTTLGALLARGYRMLSDDIAGIVLDDAGAPVVVPAFPRTKLWADAARALGHDISNLQRVRPQQEKYEIHAPDRFADEAVPLYRVYLLTTSNKEELLLEEVVNLQRFNVLLHNTYRVGFLEGLGLRPVHFRLAAVAARRTPVMRVIRPDDPRRLEEMIELIEQDFSGPVRGVDLLPFSGVGEPGAEGKMRAA
jgi:hypothetical protein